VGRGQLTQVVTATGDLEPVLNVSVSSQISGIIDKLFVDWNSPVKAGQVLAQIDPATYQAAALQAEGQLANAKAGYDLGKLTVERERGLFGRNLVTRADLDQAEAQLAQAEAQVKIQTAMLDMAKVNLARCTIYSPIDGSVISRQVDIGNTVAASLSAPTLFVIANDLTQMQINAAVAEADIGNVVEGQQVKFTVDAYPSRAFHGRVIQIRNSPQTQQNVVVYQTIVAVNNADLRLRPGMTANVAIVIADRPDALRLPNSALRVRVPDTLLPPIAPGSGEKLAAAGAAKPKSSEEQRAQLHQLMRDAGFEPGSGPPSPEVRARIQQLAKERGIELPERWGGHGGGITASTRTVYRLPRSDPKGRLETVTVRLGITDGITTEVLDGLKEGDLVLTGLNSGGAPPAAPAASPFGGGLGRRF
jgi:HlyD family secretion protein